MSPGRRAAPRRNHPDQAHLIEAGAYEGGNRPNQLLYGDNLTVLRSMSSNSVDLIYLDPPFNSQRSYNLIYKQLTGLPVPEQEEAFCDAWTMDAEKEELARNLNVELRKYDVADDVVIFWNAWIKALRNSEPRLLAYLLYMTYRLFEMRRVLKPTGSIYLHCDPAASHYIKVMMDAVFGHTNFRSEIVWKRTSAHSSAKKYGPVHDVLLYYTKTERFTWNPLYQPYDPDYIETFFDHEDADGRRWKRMDLTGAGTRNGETGKPWRDLDVTAKGRHWAYPPSELERLDALGRIHWPRARGGMPRLKQYLSDLPGVPLQDIWTDIKPIHNLGTERLGYPTQKPLALLDRIVKASSNPGDVVLDPFCGCGTAIYAAHLNGRRWIGCDIAILSVQIVRDVLQQRYGLLDGEQYLIGGVPQSVESAQDLFERDPRQFQHWVVEKAGGFCNNRSSGDHGIDGRLYFETKSGLRNMVISVKGGSHLQPAHIRELRGVLERDSTEMAGFICLGKPTKGMLEEAAKAGMYTYSGVRYPRLQIRTVRDLLDGRPFETPARVKPLSWEHQGTLPLQG
jgi:DNA modification methylase